MTGGRCFWESTVSAFNHVLPLVELTLEQAKVTVCQQMYKDTMAKPIEVDYEAWWDQCYPDGTRTPFDGTFYRYIEWVFTHDYVWGSNIELLAFVRALDIDALVYMGGNPVPELYPGRQHRLDNPNRPIGAKGVEATFASLDAAMCARDVD